MSVCFVVAFVFLQGRDWARRPAVGQPRVRVHLPRQQLADHGQIPKTRRRVQHRGAPRLEKKRLICVLVLLKN